MKPGKRLRAKVQIKRTMHEIQLYAEDVYGGRCGNEVSEGGMQTRD